MLIIGRKTSETAILYTSDGPITVKIAKVRGSKVLVGIDAPETVKVLRGEIDAVPLPQPENGPDVPPANLRHAASGDAA